MCLEPLISRFRSYLARFNVAEPHSRGIVRIKLSLLSMIYMLVTSELLRVRNVQLRQIGYQCILVRLGEIVVHFVV